MCSDAVVMFAGTITRCLPVLDAEDLTPAASVPANVPVHCCKTNGPLLAPLVDG